MSQLKSIMQRQCDTSASYKTNMLRSIKKTTK